MLYHLFLEFREEFSALNVFRYQTFRAMVAFLFSFAFVLLLEPIFIRKLQSLGVQGQPIRAEGPTWHEGKRGTPTMGGLVIVVAVLLATLLLADLTNLYIWLTVLVLVFFGLVGFFDDWRKVRQQNSNGLSEREKLIFQFAIALVVGCILFAFDFSTVLHFPFFKSFEINLGWLFIPFVSVVLVGTSNAVNLTDGLDGLAIGPVMTVAATYGLFAYLTGNAVAAGYLGIPHIAGTGELAITMAALVAGGLGFLWYNTFPAQVFMGDIGALALGALLALIAVLTKHEIVLVIAGGVFVMEAMSVLIQRYSYKLTGKRVFRMAPIHHHFELKGWAEPKIIVRFWIISIVLALLSFTTLKLR